MNKNKKVVPYRRKQIQISQLRNPISTTLEQYLVQVRQEHLKQELAFQCNIIDFSSECNGAQNKQKNSKLELQLPKQYKIQKTAEQIKNKLSSLMTQKNPLIKVEEMLQHTTLKLIMGRKNDPLETFDNQSRKNQKKVDQSQTSDKSNFIIRKQQATKIQSNELNNQNSYFFPQQIPKPYYYHPNIEEKNIDLKYNKNQYEINQYNQYYYNNKDFKAEQQHDILTNICIPNDDSLNYLAFIDQQNDNIYPKRGYTLENRQIPIVFESKHQYQRISSNNSYQYQ